MKILYLHQYFVFPEGSGGTRSYDLARSFVANGYEVEIVTSSGFIKGYSFKKGWNIIKREGLTIHIYNLNYENSLSNFKRILVFFKFLWFSTFKLFTIEADIVLATSTPLTIGIPALIKKWRDKTPFIFEIRDVWPEAVIAIGAIKNKFLQKLLYGMERLIYKNAAALVPLSTDMKESIISRYPQFICKPIAVIENISEVDRFKNNIEQSKSVLNEKIKFSPRFSILYAGTFGKVNGLDYIINLAEKTLEIDPTLVYVLIGSGADKTKIIRLAEEKKVLNRNVFILDAIGKNELPQVYSEVNMGSSFVVSIPELWANSANKFFDSLAAGRPILINHEGWQKQVIHDDDLGYVLPIILTKDAIKSFIEYTHNINLQLAQQKNALNKANKEYSLTIATKKYLSVINKIVNV